MEIKGEGSDVPPHCSNLLHTYQRIKEDKTNQENGISKIMYILQYVYT